MTRMRFTTWTVALALIALFFSKNTMACDGYDCSCNTLCAEYGFAAIGMKPTDYWQRTVWVKSATKISSNGTSAANTCGHKLKMASGSEIDGGVALDGEADLSGSVGPRIHGKFASNNANIFIKASDPPLVGPEGLAINDPANTYVSLNGTDQLFQDCMNALITLPHDIAYVTDLAPTMSFGALMLDGFDYIMNLPAGQSVVELQGLRVRSGQTFIINGDSTTVVVFQVKNFLTLDNGADIALTGGLTADHIIWNVQGGNRRVIIGAYSHFYGTVMAPFQWRLRTGTRSFIEGALFGNVDKIGKVSHLVHVPFNGNLQ